MLLTRYGSCNLFCSKSLPLRSNGIFNSKFRLAVQFFQNKPFNFHFFFQYLHPLKKKHQSIL